MNPIILIPARMASTRLANKPLVDIHGAPMIVHVWRRAIEANIGDVVVACDHEDIARVVEKEGGKVILTDPDLPSGSDRIYQALMQEDPGKKHDIVVNLQGDLPNLPPKLLQKVLKPLANESTDLSTLGVPFEREEERHNPNNVKIVLSIEKDKSSGRALYFTRTNAPYNAKTTYYHIGIYAYRRPALDKFVQLPVSPLEETEKLEQLRALEAGMRIDVELVEEMPVGVDTPDDLEKVRHLMVRS